MKPRILFLTIALLASFAAAAQSTNPLNYSGKMYLEAIDILSTPRYVSYEDHAILSKEMRIPSVEITKCLIDFEKGTLTVGEKVMKVKVNTTKKYITDWGWEVVIYTELVDEGDKAELVWPQHGKPYFQQITPTSDGVKIARLILSSKPVVASEEEALRDLFMGAATM